MTVPDIAVNRPIEIDCTDGIVLGGDFWPGAAPGHGSVIINPATGALARYYHRYAAFLARHGFDVVTYDYRGIGRSRPPTLKGCRFRWRDWGELDFEAVLRWQRVREPHMPVFVVGHSIGGFLPGLASSASVVRRMLTVGAQYGYWPDYARDARARLFLKWHVVMPALTLFYGYFPGKWLGWLEDLPAGVAFEWSFRRARMELSHPPSRRGDMLKRFAAVRAEMMAVTVTDDEFGTVPAVRRALDYYRGAAVTQVALPPSDFGLPTVGHFGLFHSRHASDFWLDSLLWLRDGLNPWPSRVVAGGWP